jgi:NitT/TauT family transport system substrate-binding protein
MRALLAGLLLALALAAVSPAFADKALTVGKAAPDAEAIIAVNVGDQLGIYKKHGLDLKIVDFNGGAKMIQAMTAGSIDIGDGAGLQMAFIAKGVPMIAVCEITATLPYASIGVPWDSPLKSREELKGKRIGVSGAGSLGDWLALELQQKEGWGPDGVQRVMIGAGSSSAAAAFYSHQIDAYIGGNTTFLAMEEKHAGRILAPVSDYMGRVASGTLFASNALAARDPDAIRAFVAAAVETAQYMRMHKDETVKIESAVTGYSPAIMAREYDIAIGMFTNDCKFDAESLAALRRSFIELNLLDAPPDMATLYSEAYLP